jgi:hypothetical protein
MSSHEGTRNPPTQQPYQPTYQPFNDAYPPPGAYPLTYVHPLNGTQGENSSDPRHPYMMYLPPPGMVYAYPPPGQGV